jgi:hypothetical protein
MLTTDDTQVARNCLNGVLGSGAQDESAWPAGAGGAAGAAVLGRALTSNPVAIPSTPTIRQTLMSLSD